MVTRPSKKHAFSVGSCVVHYSLLQIRGALNTNVVGHSLYDEGVYARHDVGQGKQWNIVSLVRMSKLALILEV